MRHCRAPAPRFASEFASGRSVSGQFAFQCASVPPGTPAYAFVALQAPRLNRVQRHHSSLLRSVGLRSVASAYRHSPHDTLHRVLSISRRTARRNKSARISERFAEKFKSRAVQQAACSPDLRCVVASDQSQWYSLSEAIDQVLVSLIGASSAPGAIAADDDPPDR